VCRSNFGVTDYGYDFNFIDNHKLYIHLTLDIFKILASYLNSATPKFTWQHEYAVFSLGKQRLEWAISYVENQKQHHSTVKIVTILERTEPL
jgi:hypothetical protein